jgi:hypothetical protein
VIDDRHRSATIAGALFVLLIALVCVRSWVPVRTYAYFDSDQALFGVMASDLEAGRSFPMFMYGQRYLVAVSVGLCAPLFAAFGASIATLKLPLFLMNVAVVAMLWRGLRSEPGRGPWARRWPFCRSRSRARRSARGVADRAGGGVLALAAAGAPGVETDYWTAFDIAWVTGERVIASPQRGAGNRVVRYNDRLDAHRNDVFTISGAPHAGCEAIVRRYRCPPVR